MNKPIDISFLKEKMDEDTFEKVESIILEQYNTYALTIKSFKREKEMRDLQTLKIRNERDARKKEYELKKIETRAMCLAFKEFQKQYKKEGNNEI